jgi:CheY-like chemotaxis protein
MSNTESDVSKAWLDVVKEILKHLYDYVYLENSNLIEHFLREIPAGADIRYVHDQVIRAVESLNPGLQVGFHSPNARTYNLLRLHYMEKLLIQDAADELAISLRQAHRDLRNGEIAVANSLSKMLKGSAQPSSQSLQSVSSMAEEVTQLGGFRTTEKMLDLLQGVVDAVERLCIQNTSQIHLSAVGRDYLVNTNPTIARQVLISILTRVILLTPGTVIQIIVRERPNEIHVVLCYDPQSPDGPPCTIDTTVLELINILDWRVTQDMDADGRWNMSLCIPNPGSMVLIVDDNHTLVNLLSRYLEVYNIQAHGLSDAHDALEFARTHAPRAIILDVMMPGVDGWEILQHLKNMKETAHIPIVVCSVLNEPDLAYSLGATLFIQKPINQNTIIQTLRKLQVV